MSTTTTYTGVRIVDMPDLGAANDSSSLVGERAGSGRFSAPALRNYVRLNDYINVKDYGAKGDATTDDTAAIQAALTAGYARTVFFPKGIYMVRDTGAGTGVYCLLNTGTSMLGEGLNTSTIVPMSVTSSSADILKIKPPAGDVDFLTLEHFMIDLGGSGAKRGRRAIYLDATATTAVGNMHIADIQCTPGNDYSLYMDNASAVNIQGVPCNTVIERCYFSEGTWFTAVGDSVTVRNCVMRSTAGSNRHGVFAVIEANAGQTASHFIVEKCNMDCAGAAIWIMNGRNVKIVHNNIESSFGGGSGSAALIDLDGTSGNLVMPEVKGNALGIFGSSTVGTAIRCNGTLEADIDNNTIIASSAVAQAILLTSNAQNTYVGFNEIGAGFPIAVNNAGVGSRGLRIPLTPSGGFANAGGGYAPIAYWQAKDGTVTLEGLMTCPATPSGLTITTLPAAARPPNLRRFPVYGLIGTTVTPQAVELQPGGGAVVFEGANTTTQVSLDGVVFPTLTGIAGGF